VWISIQLSHKWHFMRNDHILVEKYLPACFFSALYRTPAEPIAHSNQSFDRWSRDCEPATDRLNERTLANVIVAALAPDIERHLESNDQDALVELARSLAQVMLPSKLVDRALVTTRHMVSATRWFTGTRVVEARTCLGSHSGG